MPLRAGRFLPVGAQRAGRSAVFERGAAMGGPARNAVPATAELREAGWRIRGPDAGDARHPAAHRTLRIGEDGPMGRASPGGQLGTWHPVSRSILGPAAPACRVAGYLADDVSARAVR